MIKTQFEANRCFLISVDKQSEIGKAISAINTLGYSIKKITICNVYADFDTKYYHKYNEEFIVKLFKAIKYSDLPVEYKNGRLYVNFENTNIVLPEDMFSDYDTKRLILEIFC